MSFTPFDILTAEEMNNLVENIEALAAGTGLNDSVITSAKIADGAVTPADLLAGTGSSWVWQTWSPSYANLTIGNGTVVARYTQIGKTVCLRWIFQLGSTSAVGTNPTISLPVEAAASYSGGALPEFANIGHGKLLDSGVLNVSAVVSLGSSTTMSILAQTAGGTYVSVAGITSSVPFTWGNGDAMFAVVTYEAKA